MNVSEAESKRSELLASFKELPAEQQLSLHAEQSSVLHESAITSVDTVTKRAIWMGIFTVLGLALLGALLLILRSYSIDLVTTTGSGTTKVTSVTHPDVSAAWALAAAVVSGVVGLLAPTPVGAANGSQQ